MKITKNLTLSYDLVERVTAKLPPNKFSALVESLLEKWDEKNARSTKVTP